MFPALVKYDNKCRNGKIKDMFFWFNREKSFKKKINKYNTKQNTLEVMCDAF